MPIDVCAREDCYQVAQATMPLPHNRQKRLCSEHYFKCAAAGFFVVADGETEDEARGRMMKVIRKRHKSLRGTDELVVWWWLETERGGGGNHFRGVRNMP